ncbi:hypothetical protein DXG01_004290 [Tephrocybe rancida]|nr:hypothetical protein DXG01_004290 [Tephrocybe rancida]
MSPASYTGAAGFGERGPLQQDPSSLAHTVGKPPVRRADDMVLEWWSCAAVPPLKSQGSSLRRGEKGKGTGGNR